MKIKCIKECGVIGVKNVKFIFNVDYYYKCNKIDDGYYIYFNGYDDYIGDDGSLISEYFDLVLFDRKYKLKKIKFGNEKEV